VTGIPSGYDEVSPVESVLVSPNPFNPSTAVRLLLRRDSHVLLRIYYVEGSAVRTLITAGAAAGLQTLLWNGRNDAGEALPSGVYFYLLEVDRASTSGKVTLLR